MASNGVGQNGLAKIQTQEKEVDVCHDDCATPVKAQTIDELHSLQKKKSAPTTPLKDTQGAFANNITEIERQKQQLQSIRYKEMNRCKLSWLNRYTNFNFFGLNFAGELWKQCFIGIPDERDWSKGGER